MSPLYYDYTEDFDVEDDNQTELLEPPLQFCVEKTNPEDRSLSSAWMSLDGSGMPGQKPNFNSILRNSTTSTSVHHKSLWSSQDSIPKTPNTSVFDSPPKNSIGNSTVPMKDSTETVVVGAEDRKTIRLSGLGLGARELSTHVEEVFGLPPTASFEVLVSDTDAVGESREGVNIVHGEHAESQSMRNSSYSFETHLSRFPSPPRTLDGQISEGDADQALTSAFLTTHGVTHSSLDAPGREKKPAVPSTGQTLVDNATSPFRSRSPSSQPDSKKQSRPYSIDNGLTELDQLINAFEKADRTRGEKRQIHNSSKFLPHVPPSSPNGQLSGNSSSSQRFDHPFSSSQLRIDNYDGQPDQGPNRSHQRQKSRRSEAATVPNVSQNDVPNFSHQIPRKLMSRPESPMLAPKPISPARQLRLKNSVPQLMKALPALPPDPPMCAVCPPPQLALFEVELPCQFSPLLPESKITLTQETTPAAVSPKSKNSGPAVSTGRTPELAELGSVAVTAQVSEKEKSEQRVPTPAPPARLKLKMRSSSTLRPTSPPESRPWNSEDSYPWSSHPFNVGLPSVGQEDKPANPKPPKFRLKIIRASNSSVGTVRVNRESGDSRASVALHLRHAKDLFTPNSGIDNVFRQVSKHLHSRKISASSSHHATDRQAMPMSAPISDQISLTRSLSSRLSTQPSQTTLNATSATEIRSFFSDDSSHLRAGGRRLGRKISDLRARIAAPYGAANGTQSHDDIAWRSRNGQEALLPAASRSIPNLHETTPITEAKSSRRLSERMHARKLRTRFTLWFKGARSAIRARVKSRKVSGRGGDDEQVQLMTVL